MKVIERLEELLNTKDRELTESREANGRLERELEGSLDGWRRTEEVVDDGILPVPRLELVYVQRDEWRSYKVVYRLVVRHLLDHLYAVPLGCTRTSGGGNRKPDARELPYRDGSHAAHDAAHLGLPLYKLVPGDPPMRVDLEGYERQCMIGRDHRRVEAS